MTDDTLTLEESFAKASGQAEDGTLKEERTEEETEVESPAEEPEGEPEADKEEAEESELEKFDPKTLPKEMQPLYKNLMKGFTQGRQKDSEARKAAEEKAKQLEERLAKLEGGQTQEQPKPQQFKSAEEYYAHIAEVKAKEALREEKINSYREQALADYEAADERLRRPSEGKENPSYDEWMDVSIGGKLDEMLAEHVAKTGSELGFNHREAIKELIAQWDKHVESRIKSYITKQNQLVKDKAAVSRVKNPKTSPAKGEPNKKMSFAEAQEAALERLKNK